ncbi:hypothetical protein O181_027502 [Austropuccinia psidii MF-1]|uniref:Uncharacterized protein n=1 Tax=Austropuccinia psidii MF-1 TaxID=1389203 RepID=A0A9Q3CSR3_9BASI|nr:hypothetical protein [Austropuccinia psidii MF-1]
MSYFDSYTAEEIISQFLPPNPLCTDACGSLCPPRSLSTEMNQINHDPNAHRIRYPRCYHLNNLQGSFISAVRTTPSHSLSLLSTGPEVGDSVEDKEAIQVGGATYSSSDESVAQRKDSHDKSERSSVYNYFKLRLRLVKLTTT